MARDPRADGGWRIFSRFEVFDEPDLDTAIAKFDQLSRPAPRLENTASRANERSHAYFAARDWDAIAEIVADDISTDDRRRVVNAGLLHGRDATIESFRWAADLGVTHATSDPIATRGERLVLTRTRYSHSDDQPQPFDVDLLHIVEINADERIGAVVIFDLEDFPPPSPSSTPDTSPAKRPPTHAHGRSSCRVTPRSTGANFPRRHQIG